MPTERLKLLNSPSCSFGPDEFEDVRVIDAQDAHVRAAPGAALLDLLGGGVEDAQEGHRAGGHAAGRAHAGVLGPQTGKGEARTAAGLVDHGGDFTASKISSMESPTGSTKQAESWPSSEPAFISVGELGRKRQSVIMS